MSVAYRSKQKLKIPALLVCNNEQNRRKTILSSKLSNCDDRKEKDKMASWHSAVNDISSER